MTDPLHVTSTEFRTVRVFALDLTADDLKAMDEGFLAPLIGATNFDASKAEIVEQKKLGALKLTGYLRDGYGIPPSEMTADAPRLDVEDAIFALVPASAFQGVEQTLVPRPPAHFVGHYRETPSAPHEVMAPVQSAEGRVDQIAPTAPPAPISRGGSIVVAIIAILLLFLALMLFF